MEQHETDEAHPSVSALTFYTLCLPKPHCERNQLSSGPSNRIVLLHSTPEPAVKPFSRKVQGHAHLVVQGRAIRHNGLSSKTWNSSHRFLRLERLQVDSSGTASFLQAPNTMHRGTVATQECGKRSRGTISDARPIGWCTTPTRRQVRLQWSFRVVMWV